MVRICFVLLFIGCSNPLMHYYKVTTEHNEYENRTITKMEKNLVTNPFLHFEGARPTTHKLYFNAVKIIQDGVPSYFISVEYIGDIPLSIRSGKSLTFEIDNKFVQLSSLGGNKQKEDGRLKEIAYFKCERDILEKIALSKGVTYKIMGESYDISGQFMSANIKRFREFYLEYCNQNPS